MKSNKLAIQEEIFSKIIFESNKVDTILDLIKKNINLLIDFFDFNGGAVYFLDNGSANLFLNFGLSPLFVKNFTSISKDSHIFKSVFLEKEYCNIDKILGSKNLTKKGIEYKSIIAIPIFYHHGVVGCYVVSSEKARKFLKKDYDLMMLVGKEIGSFLEQVISDISIKKEKQNFKSFFNSLKDIVFVISKDGRILETNSFACRRLSYAREKIIKKNISDFLDKGGAEKINNLVERDAYQEKYDNLIYIQERDGDIIPTEFNIMKGSWSGEEAFFFMAKDLSRAREAELKSEENENLYMSLMANIPNCVLIYDNNGKIIYANNSATKILGYKDFKLKKRSLMDFVDPSHKKNVKQKVLERFSGLEVRDYEIRIKNKNNERFDAIATGSLIDYKKEKVVLLVMTDITERKKAEVTVIERTRELEDSQKSLVNVLEDVEDEKNKVTQLAQDLEKFKLAVENASDHIVITDNEGILLYTNKAVKAITGFDQEEVIGTKCGSLNNWGGRMDMAFYKKLWKTIKIEKKPFGGEIINRKKDGVDYVAMATISPILDENNDVLFFIGIERDITKEKEIDRAKSEFVSLASHQLRTPLSIISWYTELLMNQDSGPINSEQREFLEEIIAGNNRMVDLVGALLNVSRIELGTFAVNPKKVSIINITKDILKELMIKFEAREVDLDFKYGDIPLTNVDPKLFGIIIDNLVGNAIKYTPDGGKVSLNIEKINNEIVLKVSDTGYGISGNDKDKIFSKLYRGENIKEKVTDGNGLGLYIVKSIVDQSGGKIWFESVEGKGTTFCVIFPATGMKKKLGPKEIS